MLLRSFHPSRVSIAIAAGCALLVAALWIVTFERIDYERNAEIGEAIKRNSSLALAFEEHTARTLKLADQTLAFLKMEYEAEGAGMPPGLPAAIQQRDPAAYTFLAIVDARGNLVFGVEKNKALNVADRPYFQHHLRNPGAALHVSPPTAGRLNGRQAIMVTRRVDRPDGGFGGVVIAGVDPAYFSDFYGKVEHGSDGMVQLVGLDGILIARNSRFGAIGGSDMSKSTLLANARRSDAGNFLSLGRLDGVPRYQSFRVNRDFGLVVAVGASERDVLANARDRARMYYLGSTLATLLAIGLSAWLIAVVRREKRAMGAALAGEALYRVTFDQAAVGIAHNSLDGRYLRANRKFCELVQYTEEELRGKTFMSLLHPEDQPSPQHLRRLVEKGTLELENRHLRKDGTVVWVTVAVSAVRKPDGTPDYLVAMVQDISARKKAELELARAENRYRGTFEGAGVGIVNTALDGRLLRVNRKMCDLLGFTEKELLEHNFLHITHPDDRAAGGEQAKRLLAGVPGDVVEFEKRYLRSDGATLWALVTVALVRDASGAPDYFATMVQDISARKRAEQAVREAAAPYQATFDQAAVGIAHTAINARFLKVNHRFASMLGYAEDELIGRSLMEFTHPDDLPAALEPGRKLLAEPGAAAVEYTKQFVRRDGKTLWIRASTSLVRDSEGRPSYFISLVQDISAAKEAERKLIHQAHHDALTGLPNRLLLVDRLTQAITQARRKGWELVVLFVDLDRFKNVNDTLGHAMGDELLTEAAARLLRLVRSGDTVARVGGDEFVVVLPDIHGSADAARVAAKINEAMALPFKLEEHEVFVSASIGIAMHPADGANGETLLKNADVAMFRAKEAGRNIARFYASAMNERALEKLTLEADLRRALERGEFLLHFQPKAGIRSRRVEGLEALLRWNRGGKELVPPSAFVPLLEDSGLIVQAGEWVVRAACKQLADWSRAGVPAPAIAVNVSAKQFLHGDLCAVIRRALDEHGVAPELLQVEITESDAMQDPERALKVLNELKALGVGIALDDFGTGYSSLGYLKRYPIDLLKLDRSFVTGLPEDRDDVSIARAVIGMAHSLDLRVVAEGVETEAQRAFLANNGCDLMQGYLFSRPLPADQCAELLGAAQPAAERAAA